VVEQAALAWLESAGWAVRNGAENAPGDDFQRHWPMDIYVELVRDGLRGDGAARMGNSRWRRLTEERAGGAKSVFHFDVQGSVAKSTHARIPWVRFIRERLGARVHFWPFDGWDIPAGCSAIAEVYPALWSRGFAREESTGTVKRMPPRPFRSC
jgi:hypothetical protein